MLSLDVRPVLTAHPTESTRRTLLGLQARVADMLLEREGAPPADRRAIEEQLDGEVELLWLTDEVRHDRPTVMDEVSTVIWYLETRLLDASERARDTFVRAFEEEFDVTCDRLRHRRAAHDRELGRRRPRRQSVRHSRGHHRDRAPRQLRDPRALRAVTRRAGRASLGVSGAGRTEPAICSTRSSVIASLLPDVYEANRRRNANEPVRLKLTLMRARVDATRRLTAARDAGRAVSEPAAYGTRGRARA